MLESVFNFLQKSIPSCANPRTPFSTRGWLMTGLLLASLLVDCAGAKAGTASAPAPAVAAEHAAANYGKIPLSFEPNRGQTGASVKFLSRGSGYSSSPKMKWCLTWSGNKPRRKAISPPPRSSTRCA